MDGQALAGELVDQRHQADTPPVMGVGLHEVEAPDMVGIFCALNPILAHFDAPIVQQLCSPGLPDDPAGGAFTQPVSAVHESGRLFSFLLLVVDKFNVEEYTILL